MVHRRCNMKSLTIHGLEPELYERLKEKACQQGLSLNKTIKNLLETSLGIRKSENENHREDFIEFLGVWTEADKKEFDAALKFGKPLAHNQAFFKAKAMEAPITPKPRALPF